MKREEGFYWILVKVDKNTMGWIVVGWRPEDSLFYECGNEIGFTEHTSWIIKIDENRIIRKEDETQ
jgi:hypothetical protein